MAEEGEVWQEIRDALRQLAEQSEKQTALLQEMVEQGRHTGRRTRIAVGMGITSGFVALGALNVGLMLGYDEFKIFPFWYWSLYGLVMLGMLVFLWWRLE